MMSERKEHWEAVYANKSPLEVSWYQKEPALSLGLIENAGVGPHEAILDVGGGASLLVDRLAAAGYHYLSVLDISARALDVARVRLGDKAGEIEWYESDITAFNPPHAYTLWHDRAVFHFLTTLADRKRYVEILKSALRPGGHLVLGTFALGGPTRCSGLDIVQYDATKLLTELGEGFSLEEERSELHITPAAREQKFAFFRLVRL
jgi:SAM-dependent methyltransferase